MIDAEKLIENVPLRDQGALWIIRRWPYRYVLVGWGWAGKDPGERLVFQRERRRWWIFGPMVDAGKEAFELFDGEWQSESVLGSVSDGMDQELDVAAAVAVYYHGRGMKP